MSKTYGFSEEGVLGCYLKEVREIKVKSNEELITLFKKLKSSKTSNIEKKRIKNTIIKSNLRFVLRIARRYNYENVTVEDIISAGNEGLIRAIDKYNYKSNVNFVNYAYFWIKQSIVELIKDTNSTIRIPSGVLTKTNKNKEEEEYLSVIPNIVSIHQEVNEEEELIDYIENEDVLIPFKDEEMQIMKATIERMLSYLTEKERKVIEMSFGVNTNDVCYGLEEIGQIINVTIERVREIKNTAIRKMRNYCLNG